MQISSFKIFCDLVETGSFSQAAEMNRITQSAVSQQVRAMEERFGATLIQRGARTFSLTPEGRVFLRASQEMLSLYEDLGHRIQEMQNIVEGSLRISTVHSIGLHELPPHLAKYRRLYPTVDVSVEYRRASQVYADVLGGEADVGFVAFPSRRKGIVAETLWQDRLVLICPPDHPLAERTSVRFRDLKNERFVSFEPDQPTARAIDARLKRAKITLRHAHEFDNIETVKRAVEIDQCISIVPHTTVVEEEKSKRLRVLEIAEADMWRPLGVIARGKRSASPAQSRFIELLRASELVPRIERRTPPKSRRARGDNRQRPDASRPKSAVRSNAPRQGRAGAA